MTTEIVTNALTCLLLYILCLIFNQKMFKTLQIIHVNRFFVNNFVRHSSQNASIKSKRIGLVGMGNVGNTKIIQTTEGNVCCKNC